jgi:hypothetical protein
VPYCTRINILRRICTLYMISLCIFKHLYTILIKKNSVLQYFTIIFATTISFPYWARLFFYPVHFPFYWKSLEKTLCALGKIQVSFLNWSGHYTIAKKAQLYAALVTGFAFLFLSTLSIALEADNHSKRICKVAFGFKGATISQYLQLLTFSPCCIQRV